MQIYQNLFLIKNHIATQLTSFNSENKFWNQVYFYQIAIEFEDTTFFFWIYHAMEWIVKMFDVSLCISRIHFVKYNVNRLDNYECIEAQSKLDICFVKAVVSIWRKYLISIYLKVNTSHSYFRGGMFHLNIIMSLNLVKRIRIQYCVIINSKFKIYTNKICQIYRHTHTPNVRI